MFLYSEPFFAVLYRFLKKLKHISKVTQIYFSIRMSLLLRILPKSFSATSFRPDIGKRVSYLKILNFKPGRTYTSSVENIKQQPIVNKYKDNYTCIYEFRFIKQLRVFNRIKIYQTVLSVLFGVSSFYLYEKNIIGDLNSLLAVNGSMIFALVMLLVISRKTVKVVGKMYLNEDKSKVLISHLNFIGKRKDIEISTSQIEPISSIKELNETVLHLRLKGFDGSMILLVPYSKILNIDDFASVFGVKF